MKTKVFASPLAGLLLLSRNLVASPRFLGDSKVIAVVPDVPPDGTGPYPEGIVTRGNRFYVSGPANFEQPEGSAHVYEFDMDSGDLEDFFPITFTNSIVGMSAGSCAFFGPGELLYVIEPFVGVIAMSLNADNDQFVFSSFQALLQPSLVNDGAFDGDGNLYLTDSFAGTIYKVPSGGGLPVEWFTDPRLAGKQDVGPPPIGVNGIRFDKNNKNLYVSVTVGPATNGFQGKIYRISNPKDKPNPTSQDLEESRWPRLWQVRQAVRRPSFFE